MLQRRLLLPPRQQLLHRRRLLLRQMLHKQPLHRLRRRGRHDHLGTHQHHDVYLYYHLDAVLLLDRDLVVLVLLLVLLDRY
jgi:hypothetical protein